MKQLKEWLSARRRALAEHEATPSCARRCTQSCEHETTLPLSRERTVLEPQQNLFACLAGD